MLLSVYKRLVVNSDKLKLCDRLVVRISQKLEDGSHMRKLWLTALKELLCIMKSLVKLGIKHPVELPKVLRLLNPVVTLLVGLNFLRKLRSVNTISRGN